MEYLGLKGLKEDLKDIQGAFKDLRLLRETLLRASRKTLIRTLGLREALRALIVAPIHGVGSLTIHS